MTTLEQTRELDGATKQDSNGRYYRLKHDGDRNVRAYGYHAHMGGGYVCYTDGHLCECGEEVE